MNIRDTLDLNNLLEIYVFASVPSYLYKNFRKNLSIQYLANRFSVEDLLSEFRKRTNGEKHLEDIIIAYSILIAITYLDYPSANNALNTLNASALEWGTAIKNIFHASHRAESSSYYDAKPIIIRPVGSMSDSSNNKLVTQSKPTIISRSDQ